MNNLQLYFIIIAYVYAKFLISVTDASRLNHVKLNIRRDLFFQVMSQSFLLLHRQLRKPVSEKNAFHVTHALPIQDHGVCLLQT